MSKLTNMWEVFKSYREQNWFPTTEEKPKKLTVRDDPEYFKRYYEEHAEERREYARKYYQENKAKLYNNRLTKNQQLVYNYCLKEHWPTWELLPIYHIAHELWIQPYHVWRSIKALINKWKLFQDGNTTYIEKPKEVLAPTLFDENEPDLYENVHTSTELEDEVYELKRRLENAEDRYLKLLWEYEEYKKEVGNAFEEFIKANYAEDDAVVNLGRTIRS
jgi:hypothetical protein